MTGAPQLVSQFGYKSWGELERLLVRVKHGFSVRIERDHSWHLVVTQRKIYITFARQPGLHPFPHPK